MIYKVKHTLLIEDDGLKRMIYDHVGEWYEPIINLKGAVVIHIDNDGDCWLTHAMTQDIAFRTRTETTIWTQPLPKPVKEYIYDLIKKQKSKVSD